MRLACSPLVLWPININSFILMAFSLHSVSQTPEGSGCRGREEVRASTGQESPWIRRELGPPASDPPVF